VRLYAEHAVESADSGGQLGSMQSNWRYVCVVLAWNYLRRSPRPADETAAVATAERAR